MPEALNDPAVRMLWGITQDTIESWYSQASSGNEREVRGYAASSGVVEGTARVLRDVNEIGQIRDGEILVCPVTAPSWAPGVRQDQGCRVRHRRDHVARRHRRARIRDARRGRDAVTPPSGSRPGSGCGSTVTAGSVTILD